MKYYLDTNIIIYSIKGSFPAIIGHFMQVPSESVAIPSIVVAEIEYGARKSYNYDRTIDLYRKFMQPFQIIRFGDSAAIQYGIIRSTLERSGNVIGPNDMEIAAITLADDAVLVTHNTSEFGRINGLKIEDWTE